MSVFRTSTLRRGLSVVALAAICAWGLAPDRSVPVAAPPSGNALYATLLPAVGDVDTPRLAVRWQGRPDVALSVSLRTAGRDSALVAERVLRTGANLLALPLPADAAGALRLRVRDVTAGRLLHTSTRDLDALRRSSGFGWPAGDTRVGNVPAGDTRLGNVPANDTRTRNVPAGDTRAGGLPAGDTRADAAPGLYVGGSFTQAGGAPVDHLATWNGSAWSRPGGTSGAGPDGSVTALAVYDGDLIAGGSFLTAGGVRVNGIARWDGTTWSPLTGSAGTGVMTASLDFVDTLAVFDGDLIVGGQFLRAGGVTVNHIARWDGTEWWPLSGPAGTGVDVPSVWDLAVYEGALIVGGGFSQAGGTAANRIARWTGSAWSTLGTGFNGDVLALTVFDGALVATGGFTEAGGTSAGYVAEWSGGAWTALGTGLNAEGRALTVFGTSLVVGGTFTQAGGTAANYVARWDGSGWAALGGGTEDIVLALAVHNGRLVAGGFFVRAGGVAVNHVASWNGSAWSALGGTSGVGTDAGVYALHTV